MPRQYQHADCIGQASTENGYAAVALHDLFVGAGDVGRNWGDVQTVLCSGSLTF